MSKYYLICHNGKQLETVHPNQARISDNVLFQADADIWNGFREHIKEKIYDLTPEQLIKRWKEYEAGWYNS
jgi:hypothetical protein